jgi:GNAT superfamily N-acetyltransferase
MLYAMRYGLLYGEIYATSPRYEGIAIWYPPSYTGPTTWKDIRAGGISLLLQTGRSVIDRMNEHVAYSARVISDYVSRSPWTAADRWLLWILAVDPEHQKQGYASRLLRPMLGRLDREGRPCHLDTQNPDNLPLYAHYGFEVVAEGHIPGTDIPHWLLDRKPGAVAQAAVRRGRRTRPTRGGII